VSSRQMGSEWVPVPTVGGSGEGVLEGEKDVKITGERDRSSCEEGVGDAVGVK
jgi:hypothetical protein